MTSLKSRMCVSCNIVTDRVFVVEVANATAFVTVCRDLHVSRTRAIELIERVYPGGVNDPEIHKSHMLILSLCRKCAKWDRTSKAIDLYTREEVRHAWEHNLQMSILCYHHSSLTDIQAGWDNTQKQLTEPTFDMVERGTVAGTGKRLIDGLPKDIRKLVTPATKNGWTPEMDGTGHMRFSKDGKHFSVPMTPSSNRTLDYVRQNMRSVGALTTRRRTP